MSPSWATCWRSSTFEGAGIKLPDMILAAARTGYAARGFVYVSVGILAVLAAADPTESAQGSFATMAALAQLPLGEAWLILVGAGLGCFAFWRALQSLFDADRLGRGRRALLQRTGQGISALIYASLCVSLLEVTDELEDLGEADEQERASDQAQMVLNLPFGDWMLIGIGLCVVLAGAANIHHALERRFHSDLDCSTVLQRWAKPLGRAGYLARGVAFGATGAYLVRAGFHARAAEAKGLGGALAAMEAHPGGPALLAVIALGLVAFGAFGLVEARYRVLRAPEGTPRDPLSAL